MDDIHASLSTISDYIPLTNKLRLPRFTKLVKLRCSRSVPSSPLRDVPSVPPMPRSQTVSQTHIRAGSDPPPPLSPKISVSDRTLSDVTIKPDSASVRSRTSVRSVAAFPSSSVRSVSGLSSASRDQDHDQELEFDLYDCDIDNVMSVPGSFFCNTLPDYDSTPTADMEMTQLFPGTELDAVDGAEVEEDSVTLLGTGSEDREEKTINMRKTLSPKSPVIGRVRDKMGVSVTSDLTDSITSSCYYSEEEEEVEQGGKVAADNFRIKDILNIAHIDDIQFADD